MKAAVYTRQGPARDVLGLVELPTPQPGPGEVLVRIHASGVNPSDVKSRSGIVGRAQAFPTITPHSDGAGVVESVGEGVDPRRIGERVWLWNGQWRRAQGTAASHIAIPADQAVPLLDTVDFATGACFGIPLLTAVHAVNLSAVGPGDWLLVTGGAGAVAHYAIQVAAARGVNVIATASGNEKGAQAVAAGAKTWINYREEDVGSRVAELTGGAGVDSLIDLDLTANAGLSPVTLRPHGRLIVYGMSSNDPVIPGRWLLQNNITIALFLVYELSAEDRSKALLDIADLLDRGALQHRIAATFPLEEIVSAHELVEGGALGNVIVTP